MSADRQLWERVLTKDAEAWKELIKRHGTLVSTVSSRAGLTAMEAADHFQNVWASLFKNRSRIHEPERLAAWLVTAAKREALRLRKFRVRDGKDPDGTQDEPVDETQLLPDEALATLERQAELERALANIDGRCRALLELLFFSPGEVSYRAIAEELGIPFNSLGPTRKRCLEKMRELIEAGE